MSPHVKLKIVIATFVLLLSTFFADISANEVERFFSCGTIERPNIIFILIDDMGYGDLSCTGNKDVQTKNIDRLANGGIRFTQFYVASPICSPSRVAFTTGQYPQRHGIHSYLNSRKANRARKMKNYLSKSAPSFATVLKNNGYTAAHFGKWHMGGGRDVGDAPLPREFGFAESLVSFEGLGDRILPPGGLSQQSAKLGWGKIKHVKKHEMTKIYVDRSIDFINSKKDKPFYLQLWLNDVHDAHVPRKRQLEKFAKFSENVFVQKFYAVLDEMDRQIGRLIDHVDKLGLAEKTLIVLTSDNGPTAWKHYYKNGKNLAPGSSGGFRGRKWSLYEGGIRMPLIVRWKGKIPAGKVDKTSVISAIDFFPTMISLAQCEISGSPQSEGINVSDAILGQPIYRSKPIFWQYGSFGKLRPGLKRDQSPTLAMRDGDWKLLMNADGSRIELYDFSKSITESENVAETNPKISKRMTERLLRWFKEVPLGHSK